MTELVRRGDKFEFSQLAQRRPTVSADGNLSQLFEGLFRGVGEAHVQFEGDVSLGHVGDDLTGQERLELGVELYGSKVASRERDRVGEYLQKGNRVGVVVQDACQLGNLAELVGEPLCERAQLGEVGAKKLHRKRLWQAGQAFTDAFESRRVESKLDTGHCRRAGHTCADFIQTVDINAGLKRDLQFSGE